MGTQEIFSGDVYVTKNGVSKLFIMTAEYHAHERALHQHAREGANKSLGTKTHHSKLLILNG